MTIWSLHLDRIVYISISVAFSLLMYLAFVLILRTEKGKGFFGRALGFSSQHHMPLASDYRCLRHPYCIFLAEQHALGIFLFTVFSGVGRC